jgi:serine/threonine-protein kinase HipA
MNGQRGRVYFDHQPCGVIEEKEEGYVFTYDDAWLKNPKARPISLTLPLSEKPYLSKTLFPFFDGLIPEGWLLDVSLKNWKLDPHDRMGLLLSVCEDPIGAVSVKKEETK